MTLKELRDILTNRLATLAQQRGYSASIGDLDRVTKLDAEIDETQTTLAQLASLE